MTKLSISLILSVLLGVSVYSQGNQIEGKIIDYEGKALTYADVLLFTSADSSLIKLDLSGESGYFSFTDIPAEKYWIRVSYVGLPIYNSTPFDLESGKSLLLPTINMAQPGMDLSEVVVTAERPLLELKADKVVFNVAQSGHTAGNNLLELLRKSPGVQVDQNGSVSLLGKAAVSIYINNKKVPLQGDGLSSYLENIQASEIEAIEIISNPSAQFDAEGGAGIINIQLKKDKNLGANANLDLGMSTLQAFKYNVTLGANYRNKKFNLYGSYTFSDIDQLREKEFVRNQLGLTFDQMDRSDIFKLRHSGKIGLDLFIRPRHTIGLLVSGTYTNSENKNKGRTEISTNGQSQIDSVLISSYWRRADVPSLRYNFNYQFSGADKSSWNLDADYGNFQTTSNILQPNQYYDADERQALSQRDYLTNRARVIDISTVKLDHERSLLEGSFQAGLKFSQVGSSNDFKVFNVLSPSLKLLDQDLTNIFDYTERVSAAYINYTRKFDKWSIRAGLRAEQTNSEGRLQTEQIRDSITTKMDTINLFPSAGLTYKLNDKNTFQLSYSRRLNRPRYNALSPAVTRQNEYVFSKGNPRLTPEYVESIQLVHTFNSFLHTSLNYSHTKNAFTTLMDTINTNGLFITTYNLRDQYNYSVNISASFPITKWWSTYSTLTAYRLKNEAVLEDGKVLSETINNFTAYSQQTFRLPKDFSFEMLGFYSSPSLWGGTFRIDSQWRMDLGLKKKVFNGKGSIKISATDIFKTMDWFGTNEFGALNMILHHTWDSRLLRINFSYLFGNNNIKTRRRKVGLTEESKRT